MKKRRPIETEAQLLVALERFFTNISQSEPIEAIDEELREYGYDPKALGSQIEVLAKRALANSQLNWRIQARQEIDAAKEKLNRFEYMTPDHHSDRSFTLNAIQQLLRKLGSQDSQLVPAHFRNFDSASDQDLLSLLQELEFLASSHENHED